MSYTGLAVGGMVLAVVVDLVLLRTRLLARKAFWVTYAILFGFEVIVDGVLTSRGIVHYNPGQIVGWHLACAPLEDYLFGFAMILQTLAWWVWWGRRQARGGRSGDDVPATAGAGDPPAAITCVGRSRARAR